MVSDGDEGLGGAGSTAAGLGIEIRSMSARRLVVFQGRELGRPYVLDGHQTIGRSSENKICLNEDSVSRRHAEVLVDGTSVLLRDLSSTNGTYVNDQRLDDSVGLKNGDLIQIGKTVVKYFDGSNVESSYLATIYDQATRDRTTGTYNRHHFDDRLADTHRNVWPGRPPTLVLVEIHRFRRGRETLGRDANDQVLREIAEIIRKFVRPGDIVARYDSSQFAVLLQEMNYPEAIQLAEGLRARVAEDDFVFEGKRMGITVSIGLATWKREFVDPGQWSEAVESCLTRAKNAGRNRVVSNFARPPDPDEICVLLSGSGFDLHLIQAFLDTLCRSFEADTNSTMTVEEGNAERRLRSNPGLLAAWFYKVCESWSEVDQPREVAAPLRDLAKQRRDLLDSDHHVFMMPGSHNVIITRKATMAVSSTMPVQKVTDQYK